MKLKEDFIITAVGDDTLLVPVEGAFGGVVRINKTAKFIIECLQEETTKESILDKMAKKYDAGRDELDESVEITLKTLRKIGALEE